MGTLKAKRVTLELGTIQDLDTCFKNVSGISEAAPVRKAAEASEAALMKVKAGLQAKMDELEKVKQQAKTAGFDDSQILKMETYAARHMTQLNKLIKNVQAAKFVDNI